LIWIGKLTFIAAVVVTVVAAIAGPTSARAVGSVSVGCSANALVMALLSAYDGPGSTETLSLSAGCMYELPDPSSTTPTAYYGTDGTPFDWYGPAGLPAIDGTITIEGNGATIEGGGPGSRYRLFYVAADRTNANTLNYTSPGAGSLTLHNLTLSGGDAQGGNAVNGGGGGAGMGGAVFNQGQLTLDGVTVSDNTAGGGATSENGDTYEYGGGGGIGTDATLGGSGGGFGPGSFGGGTGGAPDNDTGTGGGGAGFAGEDGSAAGDGGGGGGGTETGLGGSSDDSPGGDGSGAGDCCFGGVGASGGAFGKGGGGIEGFFSDPDDNSPDSSGGGGGVGGGAGIEGAGGGFGGGGTYAAAGGFGGGGGYGGGGGGFGGGTGDPGDSEVGGGGAGLGGAVFNMQGSVTIENSTLDGNHASDGSASGGANAGKGLGGAIFNLNGSVVLTDATFDHNIANDGATDVYDLVYDSVTTRAAMLTLTDSVLTGSGGPSDVTVDKPTDTTAGANVGTASVALGTTSVVGLIVKSGGGLYTGTSVSGEPNLSPLADNGGPGMQTQLPGAGSDLLGAGSCVEATDERGDPRPPVGVSGCDIGAVEVTVGKPVDSILPGISGSGKAGQTLTCSAGSWSFAPTRYTYQWYRDGTPIQGAIGSTYRVQKLDEGTTLTCAVIAFDTAGPGRPVTSKGFDVPVPIVARCPAATGSLSGATLGLIKLGMTRKRATHEYAHSSTRGSKYKDFFCLTPFGVRVGLASPKLLGELPKRERGKYAGRVIWASTDNARYAVNGIRAGATLAAAEKALPHGYLFRVGANHWYLARVRGATAVLKERRGMVEEVGIAVKQLTGSHKADRKLMTSFD
jgi:hypothetical protein